VTTPARPAAGAATTATTPAGTGPREPRPVQPGEREPILDLLRGFATPRHPAGQHRADARTRAVRRAGRGAAAPADGADRITSFLVGWLAAGKFVSSFAILFGVGAALLAAKAWERGWSAHRLLARRYTLLAVFGLAHMVLLFPGDILFVYALTGFALLPSSGSGRARRCGGPAASWWA
jgi:uncharacterized protein